MKDMVYKFIFSFITTLAIIITAHNLRSYQKSFDNCERLLTDIKINLSVLAQELNSLNNDEVDYE